MKMIQFTVSRCLYCLGQCTQNQNGSTVPEMDVINYADQVSNIPSPAFFDAGLSKGWEEICRGTCLPADWVVVCTPCVAVPIPSPKASASRWYRSQFWTEKNTSVPCWRVRLSVMLTVKWCSIQMYNMVVYKWSCASSLAVPCKLLRLA